MTDKPKNEQERQRVGALLSTIRKNVKWTDPEGHKKVGMTLQELEAASGFGYAHISRVEAGKYSAGIDILAALAGAMGYRLTFEKIPPCTR